MTLDHLPRTEGGLMRAMADRLGSRRLKSAIDRRVSRNLRPVERRMDAERTRVDALEDRVSALQDQLKALTAYAGRLDGPDSNGPAGRRARSLEVLLGAGSAADRLLDPRRWSQLSAELTALTGRADVAWPMQQAYRTLVAQELEGLGRVAGSTYNIVGKLVAPVLLAPPPGPVLEIGTLYGLFSPALVRQFRRAGEFRHLTVLDPLAGSQIQPGTRGGGDPSGTPVEREIAERNLVAGDLRPDELRMVQGYSTDPAVRDQMADERFAVVIVDGDHSADGVHADLWWVQDLLVPGAVVIMDDFGDAKWPGVTQAYERYAAEGGRLEMIGTASTSAYLRSPH